MLQLSQTADLGHGLMVLFADAVNNNWMFTFHANVLYPVCGMLLSMKLLDIFDTQLYCCLQLEIQNSPWTWICR